MPLGQTWLTLVKVKVNGQGPKVNISSQRSTPCVPREYVRCTLMLTKSGALTAYTQHTTKFTQRMQPSPKTPLRAYSIKPLRPKLISKPKMMS